MIRSSLLRSGEAAVPPDCSESSADRASRSAFWRRVPLLLALLGAIAGSCIAADPFSIVLLPDVQYYSTNPGYDLYAEQARWLRDNKTSRNIKMAVYLGDLTNSNASSEWSVANGAYTILNNANVPYTIVPGNHDYSTDNSDKWVGACHRNLDNFNTYVGPQKFSGKSWYGGNFGNTTDHNENNYCFFSSGGLDFMVVCLEFCPRKEVLTWANNLISQHPNHRVIIATHSYLSTNGVYSSGGGSNFGFVGNEGVDLFDECASRHSNVFLVVCGHVGESKLNTKVGVCGNTVYEMVVDYQSETPLGNSSPDLGNGWLRLLTFNPDSNTISASTLTVASGDHSLFTNGVNQFYYSAYSSSPTAADHQFTMNYNMGPMPAYTYLNASTEFHDMAVNDIGSGNQLDPDIAQADNGNWAAVWEDDNDGNGVYTVYVRGFDPDGNERFADTIVNTSGVNSVSATNPSIAMAGDGRLVVAFQSASTAIKVRAYNANGTPVGSAEQTVVSTTGVVRNPDVAMDDNGNFVVVWEDDSDGNGSYQVKARGYQFDYTQHFAAKTINSIATGQQSSPAIAMAANGDYVVAWEDDQDADGNYEIGVRGFYANETEHFAQFFANTTTDGQQRDPDVAMDDTGRFVVVWEDDADLNASFQIKARGFSATGAQLFTERTVNLEAAGNQINPAVAMDPSGNWYVVWEDDRTGEGYEIVSQEFTIAGARVFTTADVQVNSVSAVAHRNSTPRRQSPVVSAHKSGRYIGAWADDMDGNGSFEILARGVPGTACSVVVKTINGTVTKSPADAFYKKNSSVTLTATPSAGYTFTGWQGDVPAGSENVNPLTITVDSDMNLTAQFGASVPPAAPSGLTASAASYSQINLTWTDNANNEANMVVARSTTAGGPYTDIATLAANVTSYANTGLTPSTTYYYVVRTRNAGGTSANSSEANATTLSALPTSPSGLTATAASVSQINLAWTDNSSNETNFVVARATTAGGPYTDVATLAANVKTYSNTGLAANTRYYYVVRATNSYGASGNSNEANALTWPADIIIDNTATGFTASSNWTTGTSATDKYGSNYRYRSTAAISDLAQWTVSVPQARNYDVSAWWTAGSNRSAAAPYIMPDAAQVKVNQQANGGKWNLLATKSLAAGNQNFQLSCWAATGYVVVADALKLTAK